MRFTQPLFLLLLFLIPVIVWQGRPSRGPARARESLSLALRVLLVAGLILGLAGLEISRQTGELAVVFLLDVSDSIARKTQSFALDYVGQALEGMGPDDQSALILFGQDAVVERPMSASRALGPLTSVPSTIQTDLAEAIRLGLALYPPGAAQRMVILSDGAETSGSALEAARLARASGVEILAVPLSAPAGSEALLIEVDSPAHLRQGESFGLEVTVAATQAQPVGIQVFEGASLVFDGVRSLNVGQNSLVIPLAASSPGFVRYQVRITPAQDAYYQNNLLSAFSQVAGPPRVLLVAPPAGEDLGAGLGLRPDEFSALVSTLEASNLTVEAVRPAGVPTELTLLAEYSSIVLVDVPARELSRRQMEAIQSYVRDLGGGLVVVGGPTSYGVGGYFRTPLEETLPVEMQIKDQERRPRLALVFVIDKSGSMAETSGGVTKVELAKEAAARSVELLSPGDRLGIVAFDDSAFWVVPLTDLSAPEEVVARIGTIRADGGTDILAGVRAVAEQLPQDEAQLKHVVLLTDGGADRTGIPELVGQMHAGSGITFSTVAVGADAAPWLPTLAAQGGGRHHFASDPASIPNIFTEETLLATRAYIVEEEFFPVQVGQSPILRGIDSVPPLHGYVGSSPKPAAQVILQSAKQDPILAAWQYGLGKAVAWTSDASGRWAKDWVAWDGFLSFWAQVVGFSIGEAGSPHAAVSVEAAGEDARVVVEAQNQDGQHLNGYQIQASLVAPDGARETLALNQVAPGQYQADFSPAEEGAYLIRVTGAGPDGSAHEPIGLTAGWVLSYSPEYQKLEPNFDLLLRVASETGGSVIGGDPREVFSHTLSARQAPRPVWQWMLLASVLLLPFDIALRRLALRRSDLARAARKTAARLRPTRSAPIPGPAEQVAALLRAKSRVVARPTATEAPVALANETPQPSSPAEPQVADAVDSDGLLPELEEVVEAPLEAAASGAATASALLRKKKARKDREK